jgi:hypothetical protein
MARVRRDRGRAGLLGVGLLVAAVAAMLPAQGFVGSGVVLAQAPGNYGGGESKTVPLEELLNGNIPLIGAVRTRGILEAGPRVAGTLRRYNLTVASDRLALTSRTRLAITPGRMIQDAFDMDADSLNMREIEVEGTFQAGVGTDAGTGTGFWFWSYAAAESTEKPRAAPSGLLAIEDLAARPARLAKETVKVRGQFRGKNLFGDLPPAGAPADGWVIKDGDSAVWVSGHRPKGSGWSLDPESRSDTTRWLEVVGKIETRDGVTLLRASQVTLVGPPKPGDPEEQ